MPSRTLVSVDEYLRTSYHPDCDYVDGAVVERTSGETDHSDCQGRIYAYVLNRSKQLRVYPLVEERVQVSSARFRVPDVSIVLGSRPSEQILTSPPLVAIEILSKDDRMSEMQERIDDYLKFGIPYVWLIDPRTHRAWSYTKEGAQEAKDGILRAQNPIIELPLPEIFHALE